MYLETSVYIDGGEVVSVVASTKLAATDTCISQVSVRPIHVG
ncbi:hypothetical protein SP19_55 [Salmonella phage 19]|nr:hypothetical protein SP19_55 [Salmonella phage 19]